MGIVIVRMAAAALATASPLGATQAYAATLPPMPGLAAPPETDCQVERSARSYMEFNSTAAGTAVFWTDVTVTCAYTGAVQYFTLPANADRGSFRVEAAGAAGGDSLVGACCDSRNALFPGGRGLGAIVWLWSDGPVAPGTRLQVRVGGQGARPDAQPLPSAGGWNGGGRGGAAWRGAFWGGGGGGATDLRAAPYNDADRIVVAGGGGGAGSDTSLLRSTCGRGGRRGPTSGGTGGRNGGDGLDSCAHQDISRNAYHSGGYGGTQAAAGAGGDRDPWFTRAVAGGAGAGPAGGTPPEYGSSGGGGGGGGLFGGGSGNDTGSGGGGGSSRWPGPGQVQDGVRDGHGQMILRYQVTTGRFACIRPPVPISFEGMMRGETQPMCLDFS